MEEESIVERLEKEINITHPQALEIQLKLYDIFIPILCAIIILVNSLIVLSSGLILHKRQQPRSTYIFLGNVALSDLLIGTSTLIVHFYPNKLRNETECSISVGMAVCATLVSVFTIGLIGIDRYLYILYGLHYQRYIRTQRARIMVLVVWLIAGVIGALPALGLRNPTDNGQLCWLIVLVPAKVVLFMTAVGMIPLALIVVLYSIILKHALGTISHMHRASMGNQGSQVGGLRLFRGGLVPVGVTEVPNLRSIPEADAHKSVKTMSFIFRCCKRKTKPAADPPVYNSNKWKAIKIVLLTTGAFFITWVPYFIASALYAMCDAHSDPDYCDNLRVAIASPLAILGLSNSLLNPIIYAWWHNGFREAIRKIYNGRIGERNYLEPNERNLVSNFSRTTIVTEPQEAGHEQRISNKSSNVENAHLSIPEMEESGCIELDKIENTIQGHLAE